MELDTDDAPQPPEVQKDLAFALESMVLAIRTKSAQKRIAFSVPFTLAEGLIIGVNACAPFSLHLASSFLMRSR